MPYSKEEVLARARAAYAKKTSTPEGRKQHRERTARWREMARGGRPAKQQKPSGYWTKERCAAEAIKYQTRGEFRERCVGYQIAARNKWVDEICSHMPVRKPTRLRKWTKELCAAEAAKYFTRYEFLVGSKKAHQAAYSHGWLNEICGHMKPLPDWTYEKVANAAAPFANRTAFKRHENAAYLIALRRGWLELVCAHMQAPDKLKVFTRQIYIIREQGANRVYIGLSVDPLKRLLDHKSGGVKNVRDLLSKPYRFLVLTGRVPAEDAAKFEKQLIARFRDRGWDVINRVRGGGLGSAPLKWTKERIIEVLKEHKTLAQFRIAAPGAYVAALNLGVNIRDYVSAGKNNGYWTEERVRAKLLTATTRAQLNTSEFWVAYAMAQKWKISREATSHIPPYNPKAKRPRRPKVEAPADQTVSDFALLPPFY